MGPHGSIGEGEGDGWIVWCVSDDGYSGEPTLSFGEYGLFLGRGTIWGASTDQHVRISVLDYVDEREESTPQGLFVECKWERLELITTCVSMAARLEAPNLNWIRDAVEALWMRMVVT